MQHSHSVCSLRSLRDGARVAAPPDETRPKLCLIIIPVFEICF